MGHFCEDPVCPDPVRKNVDGLFTCFVRERCLGHSWSLTNVSCAINTHTHAQASL